MNGERRMMNNQAPKAAQGPQPNEKRTTDNAKRKMRSPVTRPRAFKYQIAHTANPKSKIENPKSAARKLHSAAEPQPKKLKKYSTTDFTDFTDSKCKNSSWALRLWNAHFPRVENHET